MRNVSKREVQSLENLRSAAARRGFAMKYRHDFASGDVTIVLRSPAKGEMRFQDIGDAIDELRNYPTPGRNI